MNIFGWRKNLNISQEHPTFKVRYLGNVQTAVMKGDGCVDKATSVIWSNYLRNDHAGIDMKMELTGAGMKAYTKEQGLTEYMAHRISYCIAHPDYPKLFVWVYRHEGRKMKMELRCHAVLCKNASKARTMALQLREKLSFALADFKREKVHKQNSRLVLQRTNSFPKNGSVLPLRTQLLSTAKNFRPPNAKAQSLLKLGAIQEDAAEGDFEEEEEEYVGEVEEGVEEEVALVEKLRKLNCSRRQPNKNNPSASPISAGPSPPGLVHKGAEHHDILEALDLEANDDYDLELFGAEPIIDLEFGNDLEELQQDDGVRYCLSEGMDSDEESAESGFHDQEAGFPDSDLADGGSGGGGAADKTRPEARARRPEEELEEEVDETVCMWPISGDETDERPGCSKTAL